MTFRSLWLWHCHRVLTRTPALMIFMFDKQ